ncbi:Ti-type conjugative transfer relaxase TraA, partial [Klebsiella pneumoniae]
VQRVRAAEITEVRRQKHAWMREAGQQLARGSVVDGLAAYAERGHVQIHGSREAARDALAAAYVADQGTGSQIILAHSNADVQALNEAVREARKERGELAGIARFMTERGGREFAQGDRLVFLRNDRELDVKNGTLGTVERAENGRLAVRLDSGEMREFSAEQYAAVDHGYAVTIHKAQGVTVDRAYLLATPGMDRSLAYVGMTRHREAVTLFAGADDFTDRRAGRLVDHGAAPYEHDPKNGLSYFATLENDKGERHTIWGVDLERAIADSGAQIGDRIGLAHGGAQTVRLPDGRMVERNTWHVQTAEELAAGKLAQVMGRQRPKESTLDYLPDFAEQRGFDSESVLRRWVERGRAKVAHLAGRMRDALRRGLERHGRPDLMPATDIAGKPAMPQQQVESTPEDEKARKAREIAERFRQKVAQERGELAASQQRPQAEQQAPD